MSNLSVSFPFSSVEPLIYTAAKVILQKFKYFMSLLCLKILRAHHCFCEKPQSLITIHKAFHGMPCVPHCFISWHPVLSLLPPTIFFQSTDPTIVSQWHPRHWSDVFSHLASEITFTFTGRSCLIMMHSKINGVLPIALSFSPFITPITLVIHWLMTVFSKL